MDQFESDDLEPFLIGWRQPDRAILSADTTCAAVSRSKAVQPSVRVQKVPMAIDAVSDLELKARTADFRTWSATTSFCTMPRSSKPIS
jgi:hypothetical protein